MKHMQPVMLRHLPSLDDGYHLLPVNDKWSEKLPAELPLRFAFFRYLGFLVVCSKNGKTNVVKTKKLRALHVTIHNDEEEVFDESVHPFPNGVFYMQDLIMEEPGEYRLSISVEGEMGPLIKPLTLSCNVYEFMGLDNTSSEWAQGVYAPLRQVVEELESQKKIENLRDEKFITEIARSKRHSLRVCDAKWWLKAFVQHSLDREEQMQLQRQRLATKPLESKRKRKQEHPSRTATEREHENLFQRRRKEWKRVRTGELRMFTTERLHAGATVTVYSQRDMYKQLSLYAQL